MSETAGGIASAILNRLSFERKPEEDVYLNSEGLIICRNCNTPRQCRVNMFGTMKIVPCMCKCKCEE